MSEETPDVKREELVTSARTVVGDELRSVTYFTEETLNQLYRRNDLEQTADLVGFAENERLGFHSQRMYSGTQLGAYQFTIRVFEHGYMTRVIVGDHGVWVTTDSMHIDRFHELASALAELLAEFP